MSKSLGEDMRDDPGKMFHLQLMFLVSYRFRCVFRREGYTVLRNDVTAIALLVDPVHGHTGLLLVRCPHSLVDMVAVHTLAAELRQQ